MSDYGNNGSNPLIPLGLVGLLFVGSCVGACSGMNSCEYSSGERVGVVNKVSRKGAIWKTYEGEMALEGLVGGKTTAANIWYFSVDETAARRENVAGLAAQLNDAMKSGQKVQLSYKESLWGFPWRGGTDNYIQQITVLTPEPKKDPEKK